MYEAMMERNEVTTTTTKKGCMWHLDIFLVFPLQLSLRVARTKLLCDLPRRAHFDLLHAGKEEKKTIEKREVFLSKLHAAAILREDRSSPVQLLNSKAFLLVQNYHAVAAVYTLYHVVSIYLRTVRHATMSPVRPGIV